MMRRGILLFFSVILLSLTVIVLLFSCQQNIQPQPQPEPGTTTYRSIEDIKKSLSTSSGDTETTVNVEGYVVYRFEDSTSILANGNTAIIFNNSGLSSKYVGKKIMIKSVKAVYKTKKFYLERLDSTEIYIDPSGKTPPQPKNLNSLSELPKPSAKDSFVLINGLWSTVHGNLKYDTTESKYIVSYFVGTKPQNFEVSDGRSIDLLNQFNVNKPITVDAEATLTGYLFYENNTWKFSITNADVKIPSPNVNVGIGVPGYIPAVEQATVTYYQSESKLKIEYLYSIPDVKFVIYKEYNNPSNQSEKVYDLIGETTNKVFEKTGFNIEGVTGIGIRVVSNDGTKESEIYVVPKEKFELK